LDEAKTLVYKYFNCKGIRTICEVIITGEVDSFTFWVKADEGDWSSIILRARQVGVPSTTPSWQWTMSKHWLTETDGVLWAPGNLLEHTCHNIKAMSSSRFNRESIAGHSFFRKTWTLIQNLHFLGLSTRESERDALFPLRKRNWVFVFNFHSHAF